MKLLTYTMPAATCVSEAWQATRLSVGWVALLHGTWRTWADWHGGHVGEVDGRLAMIPFRHVPHCSATQLNLEQFPALA